MENPYLKGVIGGTLTVLYLYLLILLSFSNTCVNFLGDYLFDFLPVGTTIFILYFIISKSFPEFFKKLSSYLVTSISLIVILELFKIPHIAYNYINNNAYAMSNVDGLGVVLITIRSAIANLISVIIAFIITIINSKKSKKQELSILKFTP